MFKNESSDESCKRMILNDYRHITDKSLYRNIYIKYQTQSSHVYIKCHYMKYLYQILQILYTIMFQNMSKKISISRRGPRAPPRMPESGLGKGHRWQGVFSSGRGAPYCQAARSVGEIQWLTDCYRWGMFRMVASGWLLIHSMGISGKLVVISGEWMVVYGGWLFMADGRR